MNAASFQAAQMRRQIETKSRVTRAIVMQHVNTLDALTVPLPPIGVKEKSPFGLGYWELVHDGEDLRIVEVTDVEMGSVLDWHNHPQHETIRAGTGRFELLVRTNGHYRSIEIGDGDDLEKEFRIPAGCLHRLHNFSQGCSFTKEFRAIHVPKLGLER